MWCRWCVRPLMSQMSTEQSALSHYTWTSVQLKQETLICSVSQLQKIKEILKEHLRSKTCHIRTFNCSSPLGSYDSSKGSKMHISSYILAEWHRGASSSSSGVPGSDFEHGSQCVLNFSWSPSGFARVSSGFPGIIQAPRQMAGAPGVKQCVCGALWWTGVPHRVYSCLMPGVSGISSGSSEILTRINQLLKMHEWIFRIFSSVENF